MFQGYIPDNNNLPPASFHGGGPMGNQGFGGGGGGFSHKASILPTDMRCYFRCNQGFKKDYDLRLHIKLKHKDEPEEELERAYIDAEEEIALVTRTQSKFQCALCPKVLTDNGAFFCHVQKSHNMQWRDYTDQYGRCEVESASFECKICSRVVKYGRNTIHGHLKTVHGINWSMYIARIRAMKEGRMAEELPNIEVFECRICNSSVKYIFRVKHLKGTHKITEEEYIQLQKDEQGSNDEIPGPGSSNSNQAFVRTEYDAGRHSIVQNDPRQMYNQHEYNDGSSRMIRNDPPQEFEKPEYKVNDIKPEMKKEELMENPPMFQTYHNSSNMSNEFTAPQPRAPPKPPKSDIQDKTNRNCSSCIVSFESRRGFIEHCTTFHNMKFRTQSGATISAPPSAQNGFRGMQRPQEQEPERIQQWNPNLPLTD